MVFGLVLAIAAVAGAADPNMAVTGIGSNEQFQGRFGLVGDDGGQIGLFGAYLEDAIGDDDERYGGGIYATYPIARDAKFPLGNLLPFGWGEGLPETVAGDVYIGGLAGLLEGSDCIAGLIAGVRFGFLTIDYQWQPDEDVWHELPALDDQHKLFIGGSLQWRF